MSANHLIVQEGRPTFVTHSGGRPALPMGRDIHYDARETPCKLGDLIVQQGSVQCVSLGPSAWFQLRDPSYRALGILGRGHEIHTYAA